MIIKIQCPNKCCYHQPKIEANFNPNENQCAVRKCLRAGEVEVTINNFPLWMCLVHGSGYNLNQNMEVKNDKEESIKGSLR